MKTKSDLEAYLHVICIIALLIIVGVAVWGYVLNLVVILHMASFTGEMVLRVLGIFIPALGSVMGFI